MKNFLSELDLLEMVLTVLLVIAGGAETSQTQGTQSFSEGFKVVDVVDGDTVTLQNGSEKFDVRLIGVDTPEVYGKVNPGEFDAEDEKCLDRYADKASSYAEKRLYSEKVNSSFYGEGSYSRKLSEIFVDGSSFNEDLVEKGYARVYTEGSYKKEDKWLAIQRDAKKSNIGLWKC